MKFATRNGVIRRGPFSSSTRWFSTIMSVPPPPAAEDDADHVGVLFGDFEAAIFQRLKSSATCRT